MSTTGSEAGRSAINTTSALRQQLEALGIEATGVADDSRQVQPGDVFLAYPGDMADGRRFIGDAINKGAIAVIWQGEDYVWQAGHQVAHFRAENLRALAGPLAHAIYGRPSEQLSLIAITGTNGKTTTAQWLSASHPGCCPSIGTLGAGFSGALEDTGFTTPEATTLMRYLARFKKGGATACALEASSIGIEEGRMNGARVDVAVFTNLTRDHLDYHGSMEAYAAAKLRLFQWPQLRLAVINLDDPFGCELARETTASRVLGYTTQDDAPLQLPGLIRALGLCNTPQGQSFILDTPHGKAAVQTPLLGRYNVSNLLAVAAALMDAGMMPKDIAKKLSELKAPPGRLERYGGQGEPLVAVDYSHTPDALENALTALREVATARQGKLVCVFGCGGDRDKGKRPVMGEIATRLADSVWLTNDNPRSEDPTTILAEIRVGAPGATVEPDRASAIRHSIVGADARDVILLAGKGHEPYQEIAGVRTPFSDGEQAQAALVTWLQMKTQNNNSQENAQA
jgi:UDP-N-acetylmuramoyl-L-alanyl-D-glutamate--2,6-diaminopimelate ligase